MDGINMVKKYIGLVAIALLGLGGCQMHNMDKPLWLRLQNH